MIAIVINMKQKTKTKEKAKIKQKLKKKKNDLQIILFYPNSHGCTNKAARSTKNKTQHDNSDQYSN